MKRTPEQRTALRAAIVIGTFSKMIRESEVNRAGHGIGRIDAPEVRAEIAEYRNLVGRLAKMAGVELEEV